MNIIEIKELNKNYGSVQALNGLNLSVKKGEVMGFIGPNGAGKTTTIRILLGLIKADSGEIAMFNQDVWEYASEIHSNLAYVPGDVQLWPNLTGGEVIDLLGKLRGGINVEKRNRLLKIFDLDPTKKCRTYSKGNRQKVALVAALSSDVDLYIFDEPTSGLDPLMETVFQQCVEEVKKAGKTILLSSHILSEVEKICDRVSIIRDGQIVETGSIESLRQLTRLSIAVQTEKTPGDLSEFKGVHAVKINNNQITFQVESKSLDQVLSHLSQFGIKYMTSNPPTLEELFMRHYGNGTRGEK